MDRRQFIRIGGLSAASLIVGRTAAPGQQAPRERPRSTTDGVIRIPDEVTVLLDEGAGRESTVRLRSRTGSRWTSQALVVSLKEGPRGLAVEVEAPEVLLCEVTLRWKLSGKPPSRTLNDQWERTYGDVSWHAPQDGEVLPWYFAEQNGTSVSCFGVKTGARAMCFWCRKEGTLSLTLDTRSGGNGVALGERPLPAAEIVTTRSSPGESPYQTLRRFMGTMCDRARMPEEPVYGINDWYFTYGRNSADLILQHTALMAPMAEGLTNRPFSVVDSGWFKKPASSPDDCCWGDTMAIADERTFGSMERLADRIRQLGMRPGIWTRPLCGSDNDPKRLMLPLIPGREARCPVLDPSIPENLERIAGYMKLYRQWTYELVKFDFTTFDIFGKWGFAMVKDRALTAPCWSMHDRSHTNAEIILSLYQTIREAAGDVYVISCNTISHLSAGLFELNRIGDDTSGREWERTKKMGVNTLAFRGVHHGLFYAADPDCVGLTTMVPWEKNRQWMQLVASSGTPLFVSAEPAAVGDAQKAALKDAFALASRALPLGEPLDWMEHAAPASWKLNGQTVRFTWD